MPSLLDVALAISNETTPLSPDDETRALYNRAITEPASLIDGERRKTTRRLPAEEEDASVDKHVG